MFQKIVKIIINLLFNLLKNIEKKLYHKKIEKETILKNELTKENLQEITKVIEEPVIEKPTIEEQQYRWNVRMSCLYFIGVQRAERQMGRRINQPFSWMVGMISSFYIIIQSLKKEFPEISKEHEEKILAFSKDLRMKVGQFDRVIYKELMNNLKKEKTQQEIDVILVGELDKKISETFNNINKYDECFKEWIIESNSVIRDCLAFLKELSEIPDCSDILKEYLSRATNIYNY